MLGVGMSITRQSVRDIARRPDRLTVVTVLQLVLLPLAGMVVAVTSSGPAATAILLISICPGGGISNLYVLFAKANASLSVALTLTSLALANVTIPLVVAMVTWLGFDTPVSDTPLFGLTLRLLSVTALPTALGMLVRYVAPGQALIWQVRLRGATAVMILAILALILWVERAAVASGMSEIVPAAAMFLALALAIGFLAGRLVYSEIGDQFAVMVEFGVRNLAIGTFLAVGLGADLSFAGPAAIYLLIEAVIILVLGSWHRTRLRG
jgi:BASS family bile acid:Na+ symporter